MKPHDKDKLQRLAQETVEVLERGHYDAPTDRVHIGVLLKPCYRNTVYYGPDDALGYKTQIEVTNESTLQAATALTRKHTRVGVLNFASAKNPGGGFLRGTQAQEESLARASGLYHSLTKSTCADYYTAHRAAGDARYSHRMIWSPGCPVFRDDAGQFLDRPYLVDVLTAAAPNVRALKEQDQYDYKEVGRILRERIGKALRIFSEQGCRVLVLGAWGCGVFGNNPIEVAELFAEYLLPSGGLDDPDGLFHDHFERVRFAIYGDKQNFDAFTTWLLD